MLVPSGNKSLHNWMLTKVLLAYGVTRPQWIRWQPFTPGMDSLGIIILWKLISSPHGWAMGHMLWGFGENWLRYNGTVLYHKIWICVMCPNKKWYQSNYFLGKPQSYSDSIMVWPQALLSGCQLLSLPLYNKCHRIFYIFYTGSNFS